MLKCKQIVAQASEYIDGDMGLLQKLQFQFHLAMCVHCRRFVTNFKAGIEMIKRLPYDDVSQEQIDCVHRRIAQSKHSR